MPDTVLGKGDTALKNIKQGPCFPGTYKSLGVALAPGIVISVIRKFFLHLSDFFLLCRLNLEQGWALPAWSFVATSVATLIGRESHFPSHCSTMLDCLIDVAWARCISLNLIRQISVISEAATSVCAGYSLQREQAGAEVQCRVHHVFASCRTISAGEGAFF